MRPTYDQLADARARHPGMLLLFRIGDFYEAFDDDARTAAEVVGLTVTQSTDGRTMVGFPVRSAEVYLRKLLAAGKRVALCDQVADQPTSEPAPRKRASRKASKPVDQPTSEPAAELTNWPNELAGYVIETKTKSGWQQRRACDSAAEAADACRQPGVDARVVTVTGKLVYTHPEPVPC